MKRITKTVREYDEQGNVVKETTIEEGEEEPVSTLPAIGWHCPYCGCWVLGAHACRSNTTAPLYLQ